MRSGIWARLLVCALTLVLLLPREALAGFSMAVATARQTDRQEVPFPTPDCPPDVKDGDGSATNCVIKVIADAGKYCSFIADGFTKDEGWWQKARIPILVISVAGTALGVSSISSAKSWAAVGGTSGIASSWNSDTTSATSADDQHLNAVTTAVKQLAGLDPTKLASLTTAISIAAQCSAAAGASQTSNSTSK
jgi:hypothetical protein